MHVVSLIPKIIRIKINLFYWNYQHYQHTANASAFWAAPEWLEFNPWLDSEESLNNSKCDVFSMGLLFLYCIDNKRFNNFLQKNKLNRCQSTLENFLDELELKLPTNFCRILRGMLTFCYHVRPTIQHLYLNFRLFTGDLGCNRSYTKYFN